MLEASWIVAGLYTAVITVCMALTAFLCMCGCRAKERKDELVGIEGHVKMTNPDVVELTEIVGNGEVSGDVAPTVKRSLPDLPVDNAVDRIDRGWERGADTTSELYETLAKVDAVVSPTKEHPYDKLKSVEHPYAQVLVGNASTSNPADAPAGSREIAAASAITGQVHASDDLPYMTPPTHFSGDSQDSAKGYTSISVREPLAAIRAETAEVRSESKEHRDEHYTTVSDDSDDMYAAIDEPASGSETYAKLQPPAVEQQPETPVDSYSQRPAPPSVDGLRGTSVVPPHIQSHSRQESSSSATSTINSPKPEKREANSPLPAPPGAVNAAAAEDRNLDDMYAKVNKKKRKEVEELLERGASTESAISGSSESVSYRLQSNNISTTDTSQSDSCHGQSTTCTSTSEALPSASSLSTHSSESPSPRRNHMASSSSLSSDVESRETYERLQDDPQYETLNKKTYEKVAKKDAAGYETISKGLVENQQDPEYETLGGELGDPCYATLKKGIDPGYETLNNNPDCEPNYETLGRGPTSDSDSNYERIGKLNHDYASLPCDGYATVAGESHKLEESPYSSVRGDVYAAVVKQHSKKPKDPPYATIAEDVRSVNGLSHVTEPPYASMPGEDFSSEPEYESVQYTNEPVEPPYQLLSEFESGNSSHMQ